MSMNDRDHWRTRARRVKDWREAAGWGAIGARVPEQGPSLVEVFLPVRDRRRRDPHNYAPTLKAIVDGLVDARVWPDDTPEWVRTLEPTLVVGADVVVVRIEDRT